MYLLGKEKTLYQSSFKMGFNYPSSSSRTNPTDNLRFFRFISLKRKNSLQDMSNNNTVIDFFSSLFFLSPFDATLEDGKINLTFILIEDENKFPNYLHNEQNKKNINDFLLYFSFFFREKMNSDYNLGSLINKFSFQEKIFDNKIFLDSSKMSSLQKDIINRIKEEIEFISNKVDNSNPFNKTIEDLRNFFISPETSSSTRKTFLSFDVSISINKNEKKIDLDKILYLISSNLNFTRYNFSSYMQNLIKNFNSSIDSIQKFKSSRVALPKTEEILFQHMKKFCFSVISVLAGTSIIDKKNKKLDMINFFEQLKILEDIKNSFKVHQILFLSVCVFLLGNMKAQQPLFLITETHFFLQFYAFISYSYENQEQAKKIFKELKNKIEEKNIKSAVLYEFIMHYFPYVIKSFTKKKIGEDFFLDMLVYPINEENNSIPSCDKIRRHWWLSNLSTLCPLESNFYSPNNKVITFLNKRNNEKTIIKYKSADYDFDIEVMKKIINNVDILIFDNETLNFIFSALRNEKIEKMVEKAVPYLSFFGATAPVLETRRITPAENKLNLENWNSENFRKNRFNFHFSMSCVSLFGIKENHNNKLPILLDLSDNKKIQNEEEEIKRYDFISFIREATKIYLNLKYILYSNTSFPFNLMPVMPGNSLSSFPLEEAMYFDSLIEVMNESNKEYFYKKIEEINFLLCEEIGFSTKELNCELPNDHKKSKINSYSFNLVSKSLLFSFISPFAFPKTINDAINLLRFFDEKFEKEISIKRTSNYHGGHPIAIIEEKFFNTKKGIIYYFFNFPKIMDMVYEKYDVSSNDSFDSSNPFLSYIIREYVILTKKFLENNKLVSKTIFPRSYEKNFTFQKLNNLFSSKTLLGSKNKRFFIPAFEDRNSKDYSTMFSDIENQNFTEEHLFAFSPLNTSKNKNFINFHPPSLSICEILLIYVFGKDYLFKNKENSELFYDKKIHNDEDNNNRKKPILYINLQKRELFKMIVEGKKYYEDIGDSDIFDDLLFDTKTQEEQEERIAQMEENVVKLLKEITEVKKDNLFPLPQDINRESIFKLRNRTVENANTYIAQLFSIDVINAKNLNSLIICGYYLFLNSSNDSEKNFIISRISSVFLPSFINIFSQFIELPKNSPIKKEKEILSFDNFAGKNNFLDMGYHTENNIFFKEEKAKNRESAIGDLSS